MKPQLQTLLLCPSISQDAGDDDMELFYHSNDGNHQNEVVRPTIPYHDQRSDTDHTDEVH